MDTRSRTGETMHHSVLHHANRPARFLTVLGLSLVLLNPATGVNPCPTAVAGGIGIVATTENDPQPVADPTRIRLRSIRGITQRFPLFFGDPANPAATGSPDAVVVVLMSPGCPVVNQYISTLRELHQRYNYEDRGIVRHRNFLMQQRADGTLDENFVYPGDRVRFLGVHPVPNTNIKEIARHAVEKDIPFRVLHDPWQHFIRQYGEQVDDRKQLILGQVLVFDREMNLVYSGAVDDQYAPGSRGRAATRPFLARAIDSVLADTPLQMNHWERAACEPQGCVVKLQKPRPDEDSQVTWYDDIQPLFIEKKCHHCHRPGAVGSNYELLSYDDVTSISDMIEQVISDRRMPPWPGFSPRTFRDEKAVLMSDAEIELFRSWVRGGMKAGDPSAARPPGPLPGPSSWTMQDPDFIFEMSQPYEVPESGRVDYIYFPVAMNLAELAARHPDPAKRQLLGKLLQDFPDGLYVEEIEVVPGAAPVVHHIQVHEHRLPVKTAEAGQSLNFAEQLMTYGFALTTKLLGSYTPGNNDNHRVYGEPGKTAGMKLAPNANLLFELHYTPNGTSMLDKSKVGIRFARSRPETEVHTTLPFRRRGDFNIPPNQSHFSMQDVFHFETREPVMIDRIRPHLHVRGKSLLMQIVRRDQYADLVSRLEAEGKTEESIITDPEFHGKRGVPGETLLVIPAWDFDWQRTYRFEQPVILLPGDVIVATAYWDNTRFNTGVTDHDRNIPWGEQVEQEMFSSLFIYREMDPDHPDVMAERRRQNRDSETAGK